MSIKSREEIIKALELCTTSECAGCPYYGLERCDRALAKDAITLLGRANDKPVYQYALIFTKRDNMIITSASVALNAPSILCLSGESLMQRG